MDTRKAVRLNEYDYSVPGAYFVTICTKNRAPILSKIGLVGEGLCALPQPKLTKTGEMVEQAIEYINEHIPNFAVDKYAIMPNHLHLLVRIIGSETGGRGDPPLHKIMGRFKSFTTHEYGAALWQRSFYDHVIRGEEDYREIWNYIDQNPARWREDELYTT